mmetsp:Transcript_5247/g.11411  ORF Transcript_5247/g.11411 Transcript_5247/m.11411 type:complete len:213 (-) Transcript_5247:16-654(-)
MSRGLQHATSHSKGREEGASVDASEVLAVVSVHLDQLARLDEDGHVDDGASLERRRLLGSPLRRVALGARLRLRHLELHRLWHLDVDGLAAPLEHGEQHLLLDEVVLGDVGARDALLLERLHVHEDHVVAVVVRVLHLLLVDLRVRERLSRFPRLLQCAPRLQVLQLRAHKRRALAGLHVKKLLHSPNRVVKFDGESDLEVVRVAHAYGATS